MILLDGKKCSQDLKEQIKKEIDFLARKPHIVDIQIGENAASDAYILGKEKAAKSVGMDFTCIRFSKDEKQSVIENKILELNNDDSIDGILIQSPVAEGFNEFALMNLVTPSKDVDGLTELNTGKLWTDQDGLVSCTPAGVIELLKYYNIPIASKNVVIVGRSNLVGKPLINLFLKENATVGICHSKTKDLKNITKQADILVVAIGKKHFITKDMVKEGAVIVDVGINRENGKLYGDVNFDEVSPIVSAITPVPGGVGPMTVAMLLNNTLKSYKMRNEQNKIKVMKKGI